MNKTFTPLMFLTLFPLFGHAQSQPDQFCVLNGTTETLFFAVDAFDAGRQTALLAPAERLCTPPFAVATRGFVSVFTSLEAIEGCSRLAASGSEQILLEYHDFDNCNWQTSP
ncbi:MAG: hypothetical protein L3J37_00790 [Rhodobacteraceae bacterium]|nr:hypothetical protein [Paracoccaceae bacterium]